MAEVTMSIGYTHADLGVMPGTPVSTIIGDYVRENLTEYETLFNPTTFRTEYTVTGKFVSFNSRSGIVHIPAGFAQDIASVLMRHGYFVRMKRLHDYRLRRIQMAVSDKFEDQPHQVKLIQQCSSVEPGMKGLAMQTGKGKTYAAIRAICNLGYAAVVIVPGLVDQWIESFQKFCGERDEIYKIQEYKSLEMIESSNWMPKVFVCSVQTMQRYMKGGDKYDDLPYSYTKFFKHYGIGVKVVDECHLNFHATVRMDLKTNVPYNLYCSATFGQTNKYAARIFDVVYPPGIRYGIDAYDKYVDIHFFQYSGSVQERRCMRQRGYSHMRYEADMLAHRTKFDEHYNSMIKPIINQFYINERKGPGEKMLIFCSTVMFINAVAKDLKRDYPSLRIVEYVGDAERDVLDDADIIVATTGKAGTGLDVKGLICVYNTVSMKTSILTSQQFGRLRKIDGRSLIYVDKYDVNIPAQMRHANERKLTLRRMAKTFHEYQGMCGSVLTATNDTWPSIDPTRCR